MNSYTLKPWLLGCNSPDNLTNFVTVKILKRMTGREIAAMFMLGTVVEVISRPIYGFLSKKIEVRDLQTSQTNISRWDWAVGGFLNWVTKLYVIANLVALINMVLLSLFNSTKLFYICSALNGFSLGMYHPTRK